MRYIIAFAVVLVLFVLPAGSWYYLQRGFDFRKSALDALTPKSAFPDLQIVDMDDTISFQSVLSDNISIVLYAEELSSAISQSFQRFDNQFQGREDIQFVHLTHRKGPDLKLGMWKIYEIEGFAESFENIRPGIFYLVDKEAIIRNTYKDDELKDLVRHLAVLLPLPKEKDINISHE